MQQCSHHMMHISIIFRLTVAHRGPQVAALARGEAQHAQARYRVEAGPTHVTRHHLKSRTNPSKILKSFAKSLSKITQKP